MNPEFEGRTKAEEYRDAHNLGNQPLGDLVAEIERLEGIDVAILPTENSDAHGVTMCDPVTGIVRIAAAATNNPMRQRSTLVHELGHQVFGDQQNPADPGWGEPGTPVESRADAFARHLLVPLAGLTGFVNASDQAISEATLSAIVQHFEASPAIAAIQLHEANLIPLEQKQEWLRTSTRALATRYGWSEQYATMQAQSTRHRSPQRLLAALTRAYELGLVDISVIARIRRLPEEDILAEFAEANLIPEPLSNYDDIIDPLAMVRPEVDMEALERVLSCEQSIHDQLEDGDEGVETEAL